MARLDVLFCEARAPNEQESFQRTITATGRNVHANDAGLWTGKERDYAT